MYGSGEQFRDRREELRFFLLDLLGGLGGAELLLCGGREP